MTTFEHILKIIINPFTSPFMALLLAFVISAFRDSGLKKNLSFIFLYAFLFWSVYNIMSLHVPTARLLDGMNSPLIPVIIFLIFPAMFMKRDRYYIFFLTLPALLLILAVISVFLMYANIPTGEKKFYWFLIPSELLLAGAVSFLILMEPLLSLGRFRALVRLTSFLILMYGGFALRQNYTDYTEMLSRRKNYTAGILNLSETSPVMSAKGDRNYAYIPSAPCRFSADGGYIQGCNMEMAQRFLQLNFLKISGGDVTEMQFMSKILGAVTFFIALTFLCARWFCGWVCPLSFIGDIIDRLRRIFRIPHLKPSEPVKSAYVFSGLGISGFALALAKFYPHIDGNGKFMGCKIPLYPFCKICPGQQVCPVMSAGLSQYPALPGWEWVWGAYRVGVVVMLVFFIASFAAGRRLWCHFCPMGMISGIFNRGGMVVLRKDPVKCNRCGTCNEVCPMHIDHVRHEMKETDVSTYNCLLCLKCVQKCPQDSCLSVEFSGRKITESKFNG